MLPGGLKINFPAIHNRHLVFWPVIRRVFTQSATVKWPVVEIVTVDTQFNLSQSTGNREKPLLLYFNVSLGT